MFKIHKCDCYQFSFTKILSTRPYKSWNAVSKYDTHNFPFRNYQPNTNNPFREVWQQIGHKIFKKTRVQTGKIRWIQFNRNAPTLSVSNIKHVRRRSSSFIQSYNCWHAVYDQLSPLLSKFQKYSGPFISFHGVPGKLQWNTLGWGRSKYPWLLTVTFCTFL